MANSNFDSNQYAHELKETGVPEPTAHALIALKFEMRQGFEAVDRRFEAMDRRLDAMDKGIEELKKEIDKRFELMEEKFNVKLAKLKNEILVWVFGFFLAHLGATYTMIHYALPSH